MSNLLKGILYILLDFTEIFLTPNPVYIQMNINYIFIWKLIVIFLQDFWPNHTLKLKV